MLAFTSPPIENHPANGGGHKHADWIDFIGQGGDNRDGGMYIHTQCTHPYTMISCMHTCDKHIHSIRTYINTY